MNNKSVRRLMILVLIGVFSIMLITQSSGGANDAGWNYNFYDIEGSNYNPYPSDTNKSILSLTEIWSRNLPNPYQVLLPQMLTGDVVGDNGLEIVFLDPEQGIVRLFLCNGTELWNYTLPKDYLGWIAPEPASLTLLKDVEGDNKEEIFIGGRAITNEASLWVLSGTGNLVKTFTIPINSYEVGMYAREIIDFNNDNHKDIIVTFDAMRPYDPFGPDNDPGVNPRGVGLINYSSGNEIWHYEIGPSVIDDVPCPVFDIDKDGDIEIITNTKSIFDTHSGSGLGGNTTTYDNETYLIVIDENGYEEYTVGFGTSGSVFFTLDDLDKDDIVEIISFHSNHSNEVINVHNISNGGIIKTYNGTLGSWWLSHSIGDFLDNTTSDEIVVADTNGNITMLDSNLNPINSISGFSNKIYNVIGNDFCGDNSTEIIISDDKTLRIFDETLDELQSYSVGGTIYSQNLIVSDITGDGINEIIVATDDSYLYVLGFDVTPPGISDNSPNSATTGDTYNFQVTVTDDVGPVTSHVIYWFGTGSETNATMTNTTGNNFEHAIDIPPNSLEILHYRIVAEDDDGNWNSTGIKDVVINDNDKPSADAGLDQSEDEGIVITFNGSGSTDNIGIVNYTWTFTYDNYFMTLYEISPDFLFQIPGDYLVTLNVSDAANNTHTDTMIVHIVDVPQDRDYWWGIIIIVVVLIVAVIVGLKFKRKTPLTQEKESLSPPDNHI